MGAVHRVILQTEINKYIATNYFPNLRTYTNMYTLRIICKSAIKWLIFRNKEFKFAHSCHNKSDVLKMSTKNKYIYGHHCLIYLVLDILIWDYISSVYVSDIITHYVLVWN